MKVILNPPAPKGADIKNFNAGLENIRAAGGVIFDLPAGGEPMAYEDYVADRLLATYPFLEEIKEEPKVPKIKEEGTEGNPPPELPATPTGFPCSKCDQSFASRYKLRMHEKKAHRD